MSTAKEREREEALARLREWVKPGDVVHCVLRHVSRSGMCRRVSLLKILADGGARTMDGSVATVLGLRWDREKEGVGVSGTFMVETLHV